MFYKLEKSRKRHNNAKLYFEMTFPLPTFLNASEKWFDGLESWFGRLRLIGSPLALCTNYAFRLLSPMRTRTFELVELAMDKIF